MNQSICAVIVSYNNPDKLKKCIESVIHQIDKIIIVDNSCEETKEVIRKLSYPDKVFFILNLSNMGLGYALNQGIKYSLDNNFDWTLLLDQDSVLTENMLEEMMLSYNKMNASNQSQTAVIVPVVHDVDSNKEIPSIITTKLFNKKLYHPQKDTFVHFHITSGSLLKNNNIPKIGLPDETFFIDYIDYDYSFRIIEAKHNILLSKKALLMHSMAEQSHKYMFSFKEHDPKRLYYQTKNRLFVLLRYGKNFRSFFYEDIYRLIAKFFKILILEKNKIKKIKMMFLGVVDFIKYYNSIKHIHKNNICV